MVQNQKLAGLFEILCAITVLLGILYESHTFLLAGLFIFGIASRTVLLTLSEKPKQMTYKVVYIPLLVILFVAAVSITFLTYLQMLLALIFFSELVWRIFESIEPKQITSDQDSQHP